MDKSLNSGHRERLRTRYLKAGGDGFPDYDMVELLLTYAIQRRDVKPIARNLLQKFKNIGGIMDATTEDLCSVEGMGEKSALLLKLMRDFCIRYLESEITNTDVLNSTRKLREYARMKLGGFTEEVMMLICLNVKNRIIDSKIISRGTIDSAVIYPRNIAADALQKKAASVIVVHNHPSGDTTPSFTDKEFTAEVAKALHLLDIDLLDHLIVSRTDAFSFLEHGMMEERRK